MKTTIKANNYEKAAKELEAIDKGLSGKLPTEIDEKDNGHFTVALVRSSDNPVTKRYDHKVNVQQLNTRAFEKMESNLAVTGFDKMIILHNPDPSHKRNTKTIALVPGTNAPHLNNANNQKVETPAEMEARITAQLAKKYEGFVAPGTQAEIEVVGAPVHDVAEMEERLRAEFELKFGPGTYPELISNEDFISVKENGLTLKINFTNLDVIIEENDDDNGKVEMIGDFTNRSTVAQLEKFASDNNVDLTGVTGKDNILSALEEWKKDNVK